MCVCVCVCVGGGGGGGGGGGNGCVKQQFEDAMEGVVCRQVGG